MSLNWLPLYLKIEGSFWGPKNVTVAVVTLTTDLCVNTVHKRKIRWPNNLTRERESMPWTTSNAGGSCSPGGLLVAHQRSVIVTPVRLASKLTMYSHIIKGRRRRRRHRINATGKRGGFKAHRVPNRIRCNFYTEIEAEVWRITPKLTGQGNVTKN